MYMKTLIQPKSEEGLGLPDPEFYHMVVHLSRVEDWCCNGRLKLWVSIEQLFVLIGY